MYVPPKNQTQRTQYPRGYAAWCGARYRSNTLSAKEYPRRERRLSRHRVPRAQLELSSRDTRLISWRGPAVQDLSPSHHQPSRRRLYGQTSATARLEPCRRNTQAAATPAPSSTSAATRAIRRPVGQNQGCRDQPQALVRPAARHAGPSRQAPETPPSSSPRANPGNGR